MTVLPIFIRLALPIFLSVIAVGCSPTSEPPAANSEPLDIATLAGITCENLRHFQERNPNRASATNNEEDAARHLKHTLESYGYDVRLQEFAVSALGGDGRFLQIEDSGFDDLLAAPVQGTREGAATGPLTYVGNGTSNEYPPEGLSGGIAVIKKSDSPLGEVVRSAIDRGASAAVIINDAPGNFTGTFTGRMDALAVGISGNDGADLIRSLEVMPLSARINLFPSDTTSQNVIAARSGRVESSIVFGAHYDTVPQSPGANDNGSGVAVLLAIAETLADRAPNSTVKFVFFGSEELGLLGSQEYVSRMDAEQKRKTFAMVNFDSVGGGRLEVLGEDSLVNTLGNVALTHGLELPGGNAPPAAASDHSVFALAGIAAGALYGSDYSRIHTPADTAEWVDCQILAQAALISASYVLDGVFADEDG